MEWWEYDALESGAPYDWSPAGRGDNHWDNIDYHIDLGAGRLPKGRLTIDRHGDADILMDLDTLEVYAPQDLASIFSGLMPFPNDSIESIISHHCLEHIGEGFLRLMDECYRILKPGGVFRIITPLFPSLAAVADPDHRRYFTETTFDSFCGVENTPFWSDVFAEPYTKCRFKKLEQITTPMNPDFPQDVFHPAQAREIRVALQK